MLTQFVAGIIGAPFGLKGFVKVKPLSGETGHLLKLKTVILRHDGKERLSNIAESSDSGTFLVMRFDGYDNPETAKDLRGAELLVDRKDAAPLNEGEFYVEDLKGLEITVPGGEILGHIINIIEGGGGELAEIRLNNGKLKLVPFINKFFSEINMEKRQAALQNLWILE